MGRKIAKPGLELIKSFEGLRLKSYLCPAKIATIGYGTTKYPNGKKVSLGDPEITELQAAEYLEHEINEKAAGVEKYVTVAINQNQFDALVSFAYNLGVGALQKSTLIRLLNAGDVSGAAEQFLRWTKASGKELPGLLRRRQAERSLFLKSDVLTPSLLSDGPTTEEINKKLADIEKDLK